MKLFRILAVWFGRVRERSDASMPATDILDHPAIRRMSPREFADLPFARWRCCESRR